MERKMTDKTRWILEDLNKVQSWIELSIFNNDKKLLRMSISRLKEIREDTTDLIKDYRNLKSS
tara:strand:+ start:389 stop:577 length:189 start_codon:yes stop_codon:yes gene_type:complete